MEKNFQIHLKKVKIFEYVKYKLSQVLGVNQEQIVNILLILIIKKFYRIYIIKINLLFLFIRFVILI